MNKDKEKGTIPLKLATFDSCGVFSEKVEIFVPKKEEKAENFHRLDNQTTSQFFNTFCHDIPAHTTYQSFEGSLRFDILNTLSKYYGYQHHYFDTIWARIYATYDIKYFLISYDRGFCRGTFTKEKDGWSFEFTENKNEAHPIKDLWVYQEVGSDKFLHLYKRNVIIPYKEGEKIGTKT